MKIIQLSATPIQTGVSPFLTGGSGVIFNQNATDVTVQGSADGVTYTTYATVVTQTAVQVTNLPKYLKTAAAVTANTVGLLAD